MTKIRTNEFSMKMIIEYSLNGIILIILIKKLNKKAFLWMEKIDCTEN